MTGRPTVARPPKTGRLLLLLALTLVILPQLLRMPPWLGVAVVAALGWRLQRDLHGWPLPSPWLKLLLAALATAGLYSHYQTLIGYQAGSSLLTLLLCMKLLELRDQRDAMVALFLGYFLVVTGFLHSQSIFMGGYLFATVLLLTTALVALNHLTPRLRNSRRYARHAFGLLLQSLPLMVLLFILFPRLPGPLWSLPENPSSARTGLSEEMTIGSISHLADSEAVAFRVEMAGPLPSANRLYWRGPVLWRTDGRRWLPLSESQLARYAQTALRFEPLGEPIDYTLTLEPHDRTWLFALDLPAQLPVLPSPVSITPAYQLRSRDKVVELLRYRLTSYPDYRTAPLAEWERTLTLQLPATANPMAGALARQWRADGLEDGQLVERALQLFRDQPFYYSRTPPPLEGDHPLDGFLFESRRGFCEHYAAAFTTLMRAAGLPARVVTGYQGGENNPLGGYLVIRQSDAHAWSEVWLTGRGWVRVDPTAVIPSHRVEATPDLNRFNDTGPPPLSGEQIAWLSDSWRRLRNGWDAVNHGWNRWVLGFDQTQQRALMERLGLARFGWQGLIGLLFALLTLSLTVITLYLLRQRVQTREPLQQLYLQFCERLARIGIVRERGEGPDDFATRVIRQRPDLTTEVAWISRLYIQLRYGGGGSHPQLERLRRAVRGFSPGRSRR